MSVYPRTTMSCSPADVVGRIQASMVTCPVIDSAGTFGSDTTCPATPSKCSAVLRCRTPSP